MSQLCTFPPVLNLSMNGLHERIRPDLAARKGETLTFIDTDTFTFTFVALGEETHSEHVARYLDQETTGVRVFPRNVEWILQHFCRTGGTAYNTPSGSCGGLFQATREH